MAEAIFRSKNIADARIRSAGIHAVEGLSIAQNAKTLIKEADMPYTALSSTVKAEDIEWADYIFTMTEGHKQALNDLYPDARAKVFTLKEFIGDQSDHDVMDPFGGNLEVYRQTFNELSDVIDTIEQKLTGGSYGWE